MHQLDEHFRKISSKLNSIIGKSNPNKYYGLQPEYELESDYQLDAEEISGSVSQLDKKSQKILSELHRQIIDVFSSN